eukprot:PhM_4_TR2054/c2_g1_i1/m.10137
MTSMPRFDAALAEALFALRTAVPHNNNNSPQLLVLWTSGDDDKSSEEHAMSEIGKQLPVSSWQVHCLHRCRVRDLRRLTKAVKHHNSATKVLLCFIHSTRSAVPEATRSAITTLAVDSPAYYVFPSDLSDTTAMMFNEGQAYRYDENGNDAEVEEEDVAATLPIPEGNSVVITHGNVVEHIDAACQSDINRHNDGADAAVQTADSGSCVHTIECPTCALCLGHTDLRSAVVPWGHHPTMWDVVVGAPANLIEVNVACLTSRQLALISGSAAQPPNSLPRGVTIVPARDHFTLQLFLHDAQMVVQPLFCRDCGPQSVPAALRVVASSLADHSSTSSLFAPGSVVCPLELARLRRMHERRKQRHAPPTPATTSTTYHQPMNNSTSPQSAARPVVDPPQSLHEPQQQQQQQQHHRAPGQWSPVPFGSSSRQSKSLQGGPGTPTTLSTTPARRTLLVNAPPSSPLTRSVSRQLTFDMPSSSGARSPTLMFASHPNLD